MFNVLGYTRISQVGDREEGEEEVLNGAPLLRSAEQQRADVTEWCGRNEGRLLDVIEERNASGDDAGRVGWQDLLARAEAGECEVVVVAYLSRFGRSLRDGVEAVDRLRKAGVRLIALAENIDTADTGWQAEFQLNLFLSLAQMERGRLREGLIRSRREAKAAGIWCGPVPVGYVKDARRRLVLDPQAAERVAAGYQMRVEGKPWVDVARHIGVSAAGARRVIRSRTYLGGPHHEAVVDEQLWQAAQPGPVQPGIRSGYKESTGALRGLVRCVACGRSMCVRRGSYVCGNELCGAAAASVTLLDELVRDTFADVLGSDTPLGELMRERKEHGGALAEVRRRIAEAQAAVDGWAAEAAEAGLNAKRTQAGYAARDQILDVAHAELERLLALGAEPVHVAPGLTPEAADLAERRAEMTRVVQAVWITKAERGATGHGGWGPLADRVRIEWRGAERLVA